ncbi:hypothetical protein Ancab_021717 [Ancistrocladus abbreviatus]
MEIQHKSHHHPLHLLDQRNWKGLHCAGCPSDLSYPTFGCEQCNFFLHMSCLGLPEKVEHRLHPNHPLELRLISSFAEYDYVSFCNLCFGPIAGPGCFYSCVLSGEEFKMHAGCALREPSLSHPYHKHPLVVVEKKHATSTKNNTENCAACGTAVGQNKDGEVGEGPEAEEEDREDSFGERSSRTAENKRGD